MLWCDAVGTKVEFVIPAECETDEDDVGDEVAEASTSQPSDEHTSDAASTSFNNAVDNDEKSSFDFYG